MTRRPRRRTRKWAMPSPTLGDVGEWRRSSAFVFAAGETPFCGRFCCCCHRHHQQAQLCSPLRAKENVRRRSRRRRRRRAAGPVLAPRWWCQHARLRGRRDPRRRRRGALLMMAQGEGAEEPLLLGAAAGAVPRDGVVGLEAAHDLVGIQKGQGPQQRVRGEMGRCRAAAAVTAAEGHQDVTHGCAVDAEGLGDEQLARCDVDVVRQIGDTVQDLVPRPDRRVAVRQRADALLRELVVVIGPGRCPGPRPSKIGEGIKTAFGAFFSWAGLATPHCRTARARRPHTVDAGAAAATEEARNMT